jgi:hypothetical protein
MLVKGMKGEEPTILPSIVLDDYEDFKRYAIDAALVTYKPEYFHSPFLDDEKRLRRVTFHAVGVMRHGLALTFKYTFDYDRIYDPSKSWEDQVNEANQFLAQLIEDLSSAGTLVQGNISSEHSSGESLALI